MSDPVAVDAPFTLGAQIEARAGLPELADRDFLLQGERRWSWRRYRDECVRMAHFLLRRLGGLPAGERRVAMLLENHLELLALYGGCAYAGATLFGINTGLRGETLAGVLNQSRAPVLVVDQRFEPEVARVRHRLEHVPEGGLLVLGSGAEPPRLGPELREALASEEGPPEGRPPPESEATPESDLMVIYTSGTTGLPKGIRNNHFKLMAIGLGVSRNLGLGRDDTGYACMPLFHSNSIFLGFQPALFVGGKLALRERFSASGFVPDVLRYGATWWNYVGEPVHYILAALERQYGGDEARILREVAEHPENRLRYALGNGASPPDIDRFCRWLGLEDMLELYGSTEAAISTFRRKGDPRGSVGEIDDPAVKILDESGRECPPAEVDAEGRLLNYAEAVGEICRVAPDAGLFQGYFENPEASQSKFRDGVYRSGDLGHVRRVDGRRYLFFDGRTDDWIRKDGENFSAAQVARLLSEHPDVELAAAYGAPCAVSDELVMAALKLRPEADFDPKGFLDWCREQVEQGSMDPKWVPDYLRLVEDFEFTQTQKILVRGLKREHFHRGRLPDAALYHRRRGDDRFRPLTKEDFEALRREFEAAERLHLLEGPA